MEEKLICVFETPLSSTSNVFFSQHIQVFSSPYHSPVGSGNPTIANISFMQVLLLCLTDIQVGALCMQPFYMHTFVRGKGARQDTLDLGAVKEKKENVCGEELTLYETFYESLGNVLYC